MPNPPANTVRMVFSGSLMGVGRWSTSMWFKVGDDHTGPTQTDMNNIIVDVLGRAPTIKTALMLPQVATTTVDTIDSYFYNGGATAAAQGTMAVSPVWTGAGGVNSAPALLSVVASLRTSTPGRSGRGRMYVPISGAQSWVGHGDIPSTICSGVASNLATAGTQINATDGSGVWYKSIKWVVASSAKGVTYPILQVICDSKPDTQHRREDRFVPASTSVSNVVP